MGSYGEVTWGHWKRVKVSLEGYIAKSYLSGLLRWSTKGHSESHQIGFAGEGHWTVIWGRY